MSDTLSVGIIGAGGIGHDHLRAISQLQNIRVAAVMDTIEEKARSAAETFGGKPCTRFDDVLADTEVQAIHVCTPHNQHGDQAVRAAEAGKHVLVEKPMALTVAECDRMIAASERAGRVLMVGQVMRYYPLSLKTKSLIAQGAIGKVGHLMRRRLCYFDPSAPGSSYGRWYMDLDVGGNCVLYCFGPHEYDLLHWYMDSPVVRVYAQGNESTRLYVGQKDSYTAIMNHENGAVSVLSQSVVCHGSAHDQVIVGSEGSITLTHSKLLLNGEEVVLEDMTGSGMRNQISEFAACCLERRTPDASGRSVRHTMAVIEAVQESALRSEPVIVG